MKKKFDSFIKASEKYLSVFPYDKQILVKKKLFDTKPTERSKIWESFDLKTEEIEKAFVSMTKERNKIAENKGFSNYVQMRLDRYSVPKSDYGEMIKNSEKLIKFCNNKLPGKKTLPEWFYSKYNIPCFLCRIKQFPFDSQKDVLDYFFDNFSEIKEVDEKIRIQTGNDSSMQHEESQDVFNITLNKDLNNRHKLLDLIHELIHVVIYVRDSKHSSYLRELEVLKVEMDVVKKVSEELYKSLFGEFLLVYWRVFFEVEIYKNPHQDPSKLFAETFNKCFLGGDQKENQLYLLDFRITLNPLSTLPHAVAQSKFLLDEL